MTAEFQDVMFKPDADWTVPRQLPDLSGAKHIGLDTETKDPNLQNKGPGFVRKDGFIAGISLATEDLAIYLPIRHAGGGNLDIDVVRRYVTEQLSRKEQTKVGAHLTYDLGWLLKDLGISPVGPLYDVQYAEALIDEENPGGFSLEAIASRRLDEHKDEVLLQTAADAYGVDPKKDLWKLPSKYVGKYATQDARLPIRIMLDQRKDIADQKLEKILDLENRLIRATLGMTLRGIRIDEERARRVAGLWLVRENKMRSDIHDIVGFDLNEWSNPHIAAACNKLNIGYSYTVKGNPTFTEDTLKFSVHPFLQAIHKIRKLNRARTKFIVDLLGNYLINGRIHPHFKQMRGGEGDDESGVRGGRYSCANPNVQQTMNPKKAGNEELGKEIRSIFVAEKGCQWGKFDYRQQEPKFSVHYAHKFKFPGAAEYVAAYAANPDLDFYEPILKATGVDRRTAKDLALGRNYGMGIAEMASRLNISKADASQKLDAFDAAAPFIRQLSDFCEAFAKKNGFITTILGRKRHFNLWEPVNAYHMRKHVVVYPLPIDKAKEKWPDKELVRANTRTAFNQLVQGSSGDQMKQGLANLFDMGIVPHLTFHDELGESISCLEQAKTIERVMQEAVILSVPTTVDVKISETWS